MRRELGIDAGEPVTARDLASQRYRGARFSFGYPACPGIEQQRALLDLLGPDPAGVTLTESFQMVPEQSVSALVAHHPAARYFKV
jgi:5-methyltetrahydrofolate--homocysteine methyltransferase